MFLSQINSKTLELTTHLEQIKQSQSRLPSIVTAGRQISETPQLRASFQRSHTLSSRRTSSPIEIRNDQRHRGGKHRASPSTAAVAAAGPEEKTVHHPARHDSVQPLLPVIASTSSDAPATCLHILHTAPAPAPESRSPGLNSSRSSHTDGDTTAITTTTGCPPLASTAAAWPARRSTAL